MAERPARNTLPPSDSPDPGSVLPSMAKANWLPWEPSSRLIWELAWDCNLSPSARIGTGLLVRAASTSWSARARPPNHDPDRAAAASGNVRPPPLLLETLYNTGEPKRYGAPMRAPLAGFTKGSNKGSAT